MKFHYMGKFDGNYDALPTREHEPDCVPFKEPSAEKLPLIMNLLSCVISLALTVLIFILSFDSVGEFIEKTNIAAFLAIVLIICFAPFLLIVPHEFLHGLCFRGDVYMYTNFKQGLCFVVGPELFSKGRFVLMCMLPNLVFGFLPFIIWIVFPNLWYIGLWSAAVIGMGAGDYMNAINAIVQMPRGSKTYLHGVNSFWVK